MSKMRFIPFGYMLKRGKIEIQNHEAESVKIIFEEYIRGFSFNEIASIMNSANIHYSDEASIWNKNMVKRILENEIYKGDSIYPPILSVKKYMEVNKIKESKKVKFDKEKLPYLEIIKEKVVCYQCNNKFTRQSNQLRSAKWYCRTNGCKFETTPTDVLIISAVIAITNAVIESPSLLELSNSESYQPSLEISKQTHEINRELDKKDFNYEHVKDMMLCCAAKRYEKCREIKPKEITQNLMADLHGRALIDVFDPNLFNNTVSKLLIEKTGRIHMLFINGATISYKQEIRKEQ